MIPQVVSDEWREEVEPAYSGRSVVHLYKVGSTLYAHGYSADRVVGVCAMLCLGYEYERAGMDGDGTQRCMLPSMSTARVSERLKAAGIAVVIHERA